MRKLLFTLICLFNVAALAEEREAWLVASSFDGRVFKYNYIAYETELIKEEKQKIVCNYTMNNGRMILKSLDVYVLIEADFNQSDKQVPGQGLINMRQEITKCARVPSVRNDLAVPVAINFPKISVPSK
jgi:hypothetical protein